MSTELESILKEAANGSGIVVESSARVIPASIGVTGVSESQVFSVFVKTGDRQEARICLPAKSQHWHRACNLPKESRFAAQLKHWMCRARCGTS